MSNNYERFIQECLVRNTWNLKHRLLWISDYSGSQTQPCSLQPLKEAISVLFSFTRRVLDDTQFQTDVHHWLERLVNPHVHRHALLTLLSIGHHILYFYLLVAGGRPPAHWRIRWPSLPPLPSFVLSCRSWQVGRTLPAGQIGTLAAGDCCHVNSSEEFYCKSLSQIQVWGTSCGVQQFMQALTILMSPVRWLSDSNKSFFLTL